MTSYQHRCDVITSHRRWYDVILMLCACWEVYWRNTLSLSLSLASSLIWIFFSVQWGYKICSITLSLIHFPLLKGNKFNYFQFAFPHTKHLLKRDSTHVGAVSFFFFFGFKEDPCSEGRYEQFDSCIHTNVYPILIFHQNNDKLKSNKIYSALRKSYQVFYQNLFRVLQWNAFCYNEIITYHNIYAPSKALRQMIFLMSEIPFESHVPLHQMSQTLISSVSSINI